jgi:serine/threonine-protein kinase
MMVQASFRAGRFFDCIRDLEGRPAKYEQAAEQLLALHRRLPGKPAILRRLVAVFEQLRDTGKAAAFLRVHRGGTERPMGNRKIEHYRAMGVM